MSSFARKFQKDHDPNFQMERQKRKIRKMLKKRGPLRTRNVSEPETIIDTNTVTVNEETKAATVEPETGVITITPEPKPGDVVTIGR